jgi:hypothetical protein
MNCHFNERGLMNTARGKRGLLGAQGTYCTGQGESPWWRPLRLDGSRGSHTGGWTSYLVAKDYQKRVGKQLWEAKGPNQKQAEWQSTIRGLLILSCGRWRMEMLKLMVLTNENQLDCHSSMQQQFRVLRNYGTGPSLSRPTMAAKW